MHWDHIIGLPFFKPLYQAKNIFRIHGADGMSYDFETELRNIMRDPNFPVSFDDLKSRNMITTHHPGDAFQLQNGWLGLRGVDYTVPEIRVETHPNQHSNGGILYKVSYDGRMVCYASDTECDPGKPEFIDSLTCFARGVDLLIMDANYTQEEYEAGRRGWGHATWQDCVMLAQRAKVKRLCLFHHAAARSDREEAAIERAAQRKFPATFAAREGMEVFL
jgi:phosphoribosyl 1,2-cyclic phosphodiesterase